MSRKSVLQKAGDTVTVTTDVLGTQVTDSSGSVLVTYGTDRHQDVVDQYVADGWQIISDTIRPADQQS